MIGEIFARSRRPCGPGMFHDKITTHAGGKAGPVGIRRTALAPDAISSVPAGRPARARPLASCGPDEVPWIVRRCLRGHPQTQTRCAPMPSRPPPEGPMTFRPCSDAYADKTDLHAYDGDHPKLSHRTERRLSQVHLQEVLQDKGFSVVDMSQTRVPREEQNRRAASRRSVGAGHVGDTVSAASWTPLKITCLRRGAYLTNTPRQLHRRHPKAGLR